MDQLRVLVAGGLLLILLLLRLGAHDFGAAEYDEVEGGERSGLRLRLAWYVIGIAFIGAVYFIHPTPRDSLNLLTGRRIETLVFGMIFAIVGVGQAVLYALYRYGDLRLPPISAYPDAALNDVATAFIDEATFRGILLGMMLTVGVDPALAIVVQALVYALATRLGASGRSPYMLVVILGIGLIGGWVTIATGGIGAAFFGNAVTRFAIFVCTGHAGRVLGSGEANDEIDRIWRQPLAGWRDARSSPGERGAEPRNLRPATVSVNPAGHVVAQAHPAPALGPAPSPLERPTRPARLQDRPAPPANLVDASSPPAPLPDPLASPARPQDPPARSAGSADALPPSAGLRDAPARRRRPEPPPDESR